MIKTTLAPNAPWPTYEQPKPKMKNRPPKPDHAKRKQTDMNFERWFNDGVNKCKEASKRRIRNSMGQYSSNKKEKCMTDDRIKEIFVQFGQQATGKDLALIHAIIESTQEQPCFCGDIYQLGVIHRDDGPCHYPNESIN